MGKGEIARNEQFLLFPQHFLPLWSTFCHFHQVKNCRLLIHSVWKSLKFVVWEKVKGLLYLPDIPGAEMDVKLSTTFSLSGDTQKHKLLLIFLEPEMELNNISLQ